MSDPLKILVNNKLTDISELKVTELKTELKKRGISTAGIKQELYEKLKNVCLSPDFLTFSFHFLLIYFMPYKKVSDKTIRR
jgi:hypothetical protein